MSCFKSETQTVRVCLRTYGRNGLIPGSISSQRGTPMLEMGYEEIFKCLPEEKQKELLEQKAVFAKMAEIELK